MTAPVVYLLGASALTLGVDQACKFVVVHQEDRRLPARPAGGSHCLTVNRGGGLLSIPTPVAVVLWVAITNAALAITAASPHHLSTYMTVGAGMAIGGSASNLLDRIARKGVIDFISLGRWPTFNPADVALAAGPAIVVAGVAWPG